MTRHWDELVDAFLVDLGSAPVPPSIAAAVGERLRHDRPVRASRRSPWLALAAVLALAALASFAWIVAGPGPSPTPSPSAPPSPVVSPSASPSAVPSATPPAIGQLDLTLVAPDQADIQMTLHVQDSAGLVSFAATSAAFPAGPGPATPDGLTFGPGPDARTLIVGWTGGPCDERGVLELAPDGQTFELALPQPVACDAVGIGWAAELTFAAAVDPATFTGSIRHDLVRVEDVTPTSVVFATHDHGWVGGTSTSGDAIVLETFDGGTSWKVGRLGSGQVTDVATTSDGVAWAGRACVEAAPTCHPGLYRQDDSGLWVQVAQDWPLTLSFAGNAGAGLFLTTDAPRPEIRVTDDAGDTWRTIPSPCGSLDLVDAVRSSAADVLALCTTEGGTGAEVKQLYWSRPAGDAWQLLASTDDGSLPIAGTGVRIDVAEDQTGWLWGSRTPLLATSDGGATWTPLDVADGDVRIAVGADAWGGGGGTILVWDPDRNGTLLLQTDDGRAWTERYLFPSPVRCCG